MVSLLKRCISHTRSIVTTAVRPKEFRLPYKVMCKNKVEVTIDILPENRAIEAMYVGADIFNKQAPLCLPYNFSLEATFKRFMASLETGRDPMLSLYAYDPSGRIVGFHLNDEVRDDPAFSKTKKCTDESMADYYAILDVGERLSINYMKEHKSKGKILRYYSGGVIDEFKGYGLLGHLAWSTLVHCKKFGYNTLMAEAANKVSQGTAKLLGLNKIGKIVYADFYTINKKGERVYPFADVDRLTTDRVNKMNKFGKKWTSYAPDLSIYVTDMDHAIEKGREWLFPPTVN